MEKLMKPVRLLSKIKFCKLVSGNRYASGYFRFNIMKKCVIFLIGIIFSSNILAQVWPKVYGDNIHLIAQKVLETYDKGYLILSVIYDPWDFAKYSSIIKTDINGNVLWEKRLGNSYREFHLIDIENCDDGGYITIGGTTKYNPSSEMDAFIVKFNACGEVDWCRIIYSPGPYDYGKAIEVLADGYIAMIKYYGNSPTYKRIWLFRLDETGEILWQNVYAQNDPWIYNEEAYDLTLTSDNGFLITGDTDYPYINGNDTINNLKIRPFFIYVDSAGNQVWDLKVGVYYPEWGGGLAYQNVEKEPGNFYSVGRYGCNQYGSEATLYKIDSSGDLLYYKQLLLLEDYSSAAGALSVINDTSLIIGIHWGDPWPSGDEEFSEIFIIDTLGNIKIRRVMMEETDQSIISIQKTFDNKILALGWYYVDYNVDTYLWKLNDSLQNDTLYTIPLAYDSLCPEPIISDTFDCDCIVVNIEEKISLEKTEGAELYLYPNPATTQVMITSNNNDNFNGRLLKIYNLSGDLIKEIDFMSSTNGYIRLNLSGFKPGLYILVMTGKDGYTARNKLLIIE